MVFSLFRLMNARGDEGRGAEGRREEARGDEGQGEEARGDEARGEEARGDEARGDEARRGKGRAEEAQAGEGRQATAADLPPPSPPAALPHPSMEWRPPPSRNIRPRQAQMIHGADSVTRRWAELGFVVAGGGVRLALLTTRELLADEEDTTRISILAINRSAAQIPCQQELLDLARLYPARVRVAFSVTDAAAAGSGWEGFVGTGDVAMGCAALPSPQPAPPCDGDGNGADTRLDGPKGAIQNSGVMVIVYGKLPGQDKDGDAFVEHWGGRLGKRLQKRSKSKMQRVQGGLGGVLREMGFTANQVFKL